MRPLFVETGLQADADGRGILARNLTAGMVSGPVDALIARGSYGDHTWFWHAHWRENMGRQVTMRDTLDARAGYAARGSLSDRRSAKYGMTF